MAKKNSSTRRILIWTGVLVCVLLVLGVAGKATGILGNGDKGVSVDTDEAVVRDITQVVTASGKVQPEIEVKISPDVSGEIIDLRVREGNQVREGELLARIKPDFYTAQVEQAEAGVLQAQAAEAQRKADLMKTEIDLKRQQELWERKVISESDLQTAQSQHDVAEAAYHAAQYAVQSAQAQLREATEQLHKTSIFSPMTGTISQLNVELGERVVGTSQMAGTEMMRVAHLEQMEMEVDVNENDVVNVSVGDTAAVNVDAYPGQIFHGVVTEIANSARVTGAGTQEQITNFPVKVRILDAGFPGGGLIADSDTGVAAEEVPLAGRPPTVLRPGMSGTVDIYTQTVTGAVAVPIQAVTVRDFNKLKSDSTVAGKLDIAKAGISGEDLRKVVFLVADGKAHMVEVETGISDETHVAIRKGLQGGEQVIVGPYSVVSRELEPDAPVNPNDEENGAAQGDVAARR
ncbi:MAG TPA: efflux RND transporter periplasmic adaptor subunit [Rhodothermales bacterium]|nr:efflux RND transporter periplasmic adaptor subunit [Rhodothermales bacterium]